MREGIRTDSLLYGTHLYKITYPHVEHEPCFLQKIDKHTEHINPVSIIFLWQKHLCMCQQSYKVHIAIEEAAG